MTDVLLNPPLMHALPNRGRADLLRSVFTPEEMNRFNTELVRGSDRIIPGGRHNPGLIDVTIAGLFDAEKPYTHSQLVLERLGAMATQKAGDFSHVIQVGVKMHGIQPHRDGMVAPGISFIVVATGEVDYTYGGWRLGIKHHGSYKQSHAAVGDVLALNNLDRMASKRPLHSAKNGTGRRFAIDFFKAIDLTKIDIPEF